MVKGGTPLSIRLICLDEYDKVSEAEIIRDTLKKIGVDVQIEKYPTASFFQDHVKNRDFDMILLSQNLGFDSDLYSFWHSSQVNDPGLNLSGFSDRRMDKYLEQARTSLDAEKIKQRYQDAQQLIWDDVAAITIGWPNYFYAVSREVKGIDNMRISDPKDRFWDIENWYIYDKKATVL
jgi:peptide/nickel transport system substrate-binding protein